MFKCIRKIYVVCALLACSCTPIAPETTASAEVAQIFLQTCLQSVVRRDRATSFFRTSDGFELSDRPSPGPRAVVYDGPNEIIGVRQRFPNSNPPNFSCAIYGTVSDLDALHAETDLAVRSLVPEFEPSSESGQASDRIVSLPDGRDLRVISSRLGPNGGLLASPPGNVRLIVYSGDL